jgi:hypothetical protein
VKPQTHAELFAMLPDEIDVRLEKLIDHMARRAIEEGIGVRRRGERRWTPNRSC